MVICYKRVAQRELDTSNYVRNSVVGILPLQETVFETTDGSLPSNNHVQSLVVDIHNFIPTAVPLRECPEMRNEE